MSFQHFRLGDMSMHQPLPPHLMVGAGGAPVMGMGAHQQQSGVPNGHAQFAPPAPDNNTTTFVTNSGTISSNSSSKALYGSGDADDGYGLVFPNLDAFYQWKAKEEESKVVEFVKGDTHGSKAVPPRFKDHTKLVCARHSRSGRKKYVKKHPERVRKVPSRKLDGTGCHASISFKTYFDTEEVRVNYQSNHSHEIGEANLPYTRRGRREALALNKERPAGKASKTEQASSPAPAGPSAPVPSHPQFANAVSMVPPMPFAAHHTPHAFFPPHPNQQFGMPAPTPMSQDRWENMATLFQSVRENARAFEYPLPSIAALESCLIRLYLESPQAMMAAGMHPQQHPHPGMMSAPPSAISAQPVPQQQANNESGGDGESESDSEESS